MSEHTTEGQSPLTAPISRRTLLQRGVTAAAAAAGAGTLASLAGSEMASAAIQHEPPFNIVGRAPVTITFAAWGGPEAIKPFQKTMQKFMARNPGIKVKLIAIPAQGWAALFETIITKIAAGNAPDILRVAIEGIALFGSKNLAYPLNSFMKTDAAFIEELRGDTLPVMWKVLAYKGKQLALPFSWNNMMVWYNTNLVSRPKTNWTGDDFLAMCARLKKQGRYGTYLWDSGLFGLEAWSLAAGANLLNDDWTRSTATDRGNLVAWELMHDLVSKYKYAPRPHANFPQVTFFESGRLGTFLAGRWQLFQLKQDKFCTSSSCPADVQFFPVLGGGARKVIFGIDGYPVIRTSKHPEAAWELSKYLSTKEAMYDWMVQGTNIPCRKSLAYAKWMNPPAHYRDFFDSLAAGGTAVTSPPQYNEIDTATTKWYSKMMANQVSPKAALAGLDKDITAILKKPA